MKKDKINLALLWANYGGEVTSVNDLVLALDKERFNVIFIYLSGYGVKENLIEEAGYDVFYLSNIQRIRAFRFSILRGLVGILKEHNIDIIHCHAHKPTVYGTIAAMMAKTPVVLAHVHGLGRSSGFRRKLQNFVLFRKIDRIISVADSVKEDVLKSNPAVCPEKVITLENSVDFDRFSNVSITKGEAKSKLAVVPADAFVYGTIARFGPYKGHSFLISAFEKVKKQVPSAHLILVGHGDLRQDLEKDVEKTGLFDSIHFLGYRNDIEKIYKAMDALVLPSIGSEGMPRVILEAMAAGVPCIGTKVGGTPEVICNKDVGFLVPPGDENALAEAMIKLANTPKQDIKVLIGRAQERIRSNFGHEVVIKKLENIYKTELTRYYESDKRQKSNV